jgi:hypothetical protein
MSLVNCLECNKEISDKANNCIHCGCPCNKEPQSLPVNPDEPQHRNSEKQINKAVDMVFALLYIFMFYQLFVSDSAINTDSNSGAYMFGIFMFFVFLYFIQKMVKAILGTVARSFDSAFNKKTK